MPANLGYWAIRGLASPIRYLLEYVGAEYEETRYESGDKWFPVKFDLGLDFPNLPWFEDGDVKINQSGAIPVTWQKNTTCMARTSRRGPRWKCWHLNAWTSTWLMPRLSTTLTLKS